MVAAMVSTAAAQVVPADDDDSDVINVSRSRTVKHLKPYTLAIGPMVGGNYAVAGNPEGMDLNLSGSAGFSAGLGANVRFGRPEGRPFGTERFGVQVEALYALRTLTTNVENISMNCFEIPVLFQWYFLPTLAVEVGPTFTGSFASSPKELNYNNAIYEMDKMSAYDVMFSLGLNYKLKGGFTAELRYNIGTSDLAGNFKTKVSTLSLGIGWLFTAIK